MHKKIKLRQLAYNIDYQIVGNTIIKLKYENFSEGKVKLELFKNNEEAEEKEFAVYGYSKALDEQGSFLQIIEFKQLNESKPVLIKDNEHEIQFTHYGKEKYNYPNSVLEKIIIMNF